VVLILCFPAIPLAGCFIAAVDFVAALVGCAFASGEKEIVSTAIAIIGSRFFIASSFGSQ
jgi:hypothetical protein